MLRKILPSFSLSLPEVVPGEHEHMIHYSSFKASLRHKKSNLDAIAAGTRLPKPKRGVESYVGLALTLLACALMWSLSKQLPALYPLLYTFIFFPALYAARYTLFSPTAVQIGNKGIRFHSATAAWKWSSPWIPWDAIEYASAQSYRQPSQVMGADSISVNLAVDTMSLDANGKKFAFVISQIIGRRKSKSEVDIQLDLNSIVRDQDLPLLISSLRHFMGNERIDPTVDQICLQDDVASFTALWLDDFNSRHASNSESIFSGSLLREKYKVLDRIAIGGLSTTLLAELIDSDSQEIVVLKQITLPTGGGKEILTRALENVKREADMLRRLDHPQIVKCIDIFVEGKNAYIGLEYVRGTTLRKLVSDRGPLPEAEAIDISRQCLEILQYLHAQKPPVLHRDFTPTNLIVDENNRVTLIDFNVAEQNEGQETKTVVGKRNYVPPEQFRGKATEQSDIYAFGCCLYFMLTGEDPEPISTSQPRSLNQHVSAELDEIVSDATNIKAEKRFKHVNEIVERLNSVAVT
ncbi:MAG: serine/threonine protein kinase [Candidatus Obscuribacterales bacterium]|nr:serine/threonine protein kinase [Candidatus Obscuribacterales bacterium]